MKSKRVGKEIKVDDHSKRRGKRKTYAMEKAAGKKAGWWQNRLRQEGKRSQANWKNTEEVP